jgi:two-component system sensor histidine kinase BarA
MNNQPTVLYVEDDPQSRKLMNMLLKGRMGLSNVTIFEDSTDFTSRIESLETKPDIIFLDIHMKPYDGFEMLEMLRKIESTSDTPVIALTASVMNEEVHRLRTAGFNGCLAKPIDLNTFPEMMTRILDGEVIWRIVD